MTLDEGCNINTGRNNTLGAQTNSNDSTAYLIYRLFTRDVRRKRYFIIILRQIPKCNSKVVWEHTPEICIEFEELILRQCIIC